MKIEILGDGCVRCRQLKTRTEQAVQELGKDAEIEAVNDPARLAGYGALSLPRLVVDGRVHEQAGGMTIEEIKSLLRGERK